MNKVILTVAPVSADAARLIPDEVARDVADCVAEGASIVHLHVRDEKARLTDDLTVLRETVGEIDARTDAVIQISTGGVSSMTIAQRCAPLAMERIEMASLNVGSVNLGEAVYTNPIGDVRYCVSQLERRNILPEVEVFELGMIHTMIGLSRTSSLRSPLLFNVILGAAGAAPATPEALFALRGAIPTGALWGLSHAGRRDMRMLVAGVLLGAATVRIGFEDSVMLDETTTARSNAELVGALARILRSCGVVIATPAEAREILGLASR